jgi:GH35 family endo-1,4-beta-xylanase
MISNLTIPHLRQHDDTKQLVVNGMPYLMLGGELQNSSLSSAEYMSEVWPKMLATNVNTLLGSVSWEMIEPEEGKFDFDELDRVILGARNHGLHLILLWFGSFKNGMLVHLHDFFLSTHADMIRQIYIYSIMGQNKSYTLPSRRTSQGRRCN